MISKLDESCAFKPPQARHCETRRTRRRNFDFKLNLNEARATNADHQTGTGSPTAPGPAWSRVLGGGGWRIVT